MADHVRDAHVVGVHDAHVAQVPERLHRGLLAVGEHQEDAAVAVEAGDRLGRRLGRRRVERGRVEPGDRAPLGVHRQGRPQRAPARLAVHLDRVGARLRAERHATALAVGGRERAHASAARALLAPGLGAGHRDLAAHLRGRRAATLRRELRAHRLVHERPAEALAEDGLVQRERAGAAADVLGRGSHYASLLISTTPPFGPGTEPRTRSRFSRMSTTSRPRWVTRLFPIWPGPRMPLNTRAGSAEAPIEPGARTLCEPCDLGPEAKLCRLIVPAKPLPFEVPDTLTVWPFSKTEPTASSAPTSSSPGSPRHSARCFSQPTPAFFRWPSFGLLSDFSRTSPNATWTAS